MNTQSTPPSYHQLNIDAEKRWEKRTQEEKQLWEIEAITRPILDELSQCTTPELFRRFSVSGEFQKVIRGRSVFAAKAGSSGGKAQRNRFAEFNQLCEEIVRQRPTISAADFERAIVSLQDREAIYDVTERAITIVNSKGTLREIARSGLKHRLSRTKAKLADKESR